MGAPQRLSHFADGKRQDAAGTLLFSSAASPWAGFRVESRSLDRGSEKRRHWPTARMGIVKTGELQLQERPNKHITNPFLTAKGSVTIWPAGYSSTSFDWTGAAELVDLEIGPDVAELLGDFDFPCAPLAAQRGIQDPPLAALVFAMETEIRPGCPSGRVYGESISIALAWYVTARYAVSQRPPRGSKGGLSRRRLSKILDFVQANLGSDLGVAELAALAHLSPSHFVQAFRFSVNMTPHQYVTQQRIAEAKRLLTLGHLSIAEVALVVGFAWRDLPSISGRDAKALSAAAYKPYNAQHRSNSINFRQISRGCIKVDSYDGWASLPPTKKENGGNGHINGVASTRPMAAIALALGLSVGSSLAPPHAPAASDLSINTKEGPVQGLINDGVAEFLGIPYAKPPVGGLRWMPPQGPAKWTSVLKANSSLTPARRSLPWGCSQDPRTSTKTAFISTSSRRTSTRQRSCRSSSGFMAAAMSTARATTMTGASSLTWATPSSSPSTTA